MLTVFFGSDRKKVADTAQIKAKAISKSPVTIDEHGFLPGQFIELVSSSSLFGEIGVYIIDTPSASSEFYEECLDNMKDMSESANQFFVIEGSLLAPAKKKFAKYAEQIKEFSADKPERFNTFGLADALARRDKKSLWVMIQEAQLVGVKEEEIIGILWWQLKAVRLSATTSSAQEAGLKDYPYRKAKQALNKFSNQEVLNLSHSLLSLYHRGHKGKCDIKLALERWVLSM